MEKNPLHYDVIILGSGPAGLQAAVHAARAKTRVVVLGRVQRSSLYKAHIENYCCMDDILAGEDILDQGRRQAEKFGAEFMDVDVVGIDLLENGTLSASLESGENLHAAAVILAMGVSRNRLGVPGEKDLLGKGVSYCVECDGNFFRGEPVAVVGNESAAFSGALHLLLLASEVHLVYEEARVNEHLGFQVESSDIVKHRGTWVKSIVGENELEEVELQSGEKLQVKGIFIELGAKGALDLAANLGVMLDTESLRYISVNKKQETNVPGIYAAGDICGPPWQMAKAVGEGCVAGMEAAAYAKKHRKMS